MKLLLVLGLLSAAPAAASPADMASAVGDFYAVHQQSGQDGIPDEALRAKYAPTISPALRALLEAAAAAQERFEKDHKNAPPVIDGDLFSPNFDGVSSYKVGTCTQDAGGGRCTVGLHYAPQNPRARDKPADWTDTVYLVDVGGSWRVNDIAFGGDWDAGNQGRLTDVLKSVIADTGE
jgi:hypothetical protein